MLVVDSGVWIDFFNGQGGPEVVALRGLLQEGELRIVVPDLVLYEVLRGFHHERDFRQARVLMESFGIETAGGADIARDAAQHYRSLRAAGFATRNAVDVLIAAFCIENGYALLHRNRDFDAFERFRGLRTWRQ